MTVAELKELLKDVPDNAQVWFAGEYDRNIEEAEYIKHNNEIILR